MTDRKILVDTSAWIDSFKGGLQEGTERFLQEAIEAGDVVTVPVVVLELLQGCRTEAERDNLKDLLYSLDVLDFTPETWEMAYELGYDTRRKGVTVPVVDIMIAALALESECTVMHKDRHFDLLAQHSDLEVMAV